MKNHLQQARFIAFLLIACVQGGASVCIGQTLAEALDTTNLVWTTGGDAVWFGQTTDTHDGIDAGRSGIVGSNQTSWIETTVIGPGTISFWSKISGVSQPVSSSFSINGNPPGSSIIIQAVLLDRWNATTNDLYEGPNVLRWAVSAHHGIASQGFLALDEFAMSPPRPLAIAYQPNGETVYSGEFASLALAVVGTPPFHYQWFKDGTNIADATNDWIYFEQATTNDTGVYSVIVSNAQDFVVGSNALLTVLPPALPSFTSEPESAAIYSGQSWSLYAGVDGSPPFTYQWRKNETNLSEAVSTSWGSFSLELANFSQADAGNYSLTVSNSLGGVVSSNAVLTVIQSVAPVITRQPRSLEVAEGTYTRMSIEATGTPDPWYKWKKVGEPPPDSELPPLPPVSVSGQTYKLFNNVTSNDAGIYFATVSNYAGGVISRDALLIVLPPLSIKGYWPQGAEDIFVTNGLAFLAQGTNGLTILDVSNPESPQWLATYNTPGYASSVRVLNDMAFVADGSAGLQIISVTNPSNPMLAGGYDTAGYASDLAVRSNLVFMADGNSGFLILNVSNASSPSVMGSYSTNLSPMRVCISGNLAYLTSLAPVIVPGSNYWVGGMLVVDVSNPAQPMEISRVGTSVYTATAWGEFVIADGTVFSVTNPADPKVISAMPPYRTNFSGPAYFQPGDAQAVDGLVYFVSSPGDYIKMSVYDIRDPADAIPVGHIEAPGYASRIFVDGNLVYTVGYESPLLIVETPFDPHPETSPELSLSVQNGLTLELRGRRGGHYCIETSDSLTVPAWETLQTLLLTNDISAIELPAPTDSRFFRLRQVD